MNKHIVGEWVGSDKDGIGVSVSMHDSSKLVYSVGRDLIEGTWRLNESVDPAHLDFHLHTEDHLTMRMIARLTSEDTLQIRIDDSNSGARPTDFLTTDDNDRQLTLKRKMDT